MPIEVHIDRRARIVTAIPRGTLTHEEMIKYQKSVWSRPSVRRFDEVVDMSYVAGLDFESPQQVMSLAELSAGMDDPNIRTRLAIVASDKLHDALARMYRAYRDQDARSRRHVEIFHSVEEALKWLRPKQGKPPVARPAKRK